MRLARSSMVEGTVPSLELKETTMVTISRLLAAGVALAAGAALAGMAKADGISLYYYDESPSFTYGYTTTPRVYYYSDPVIVAPAPRSYYYSEPMIVTPAPRAYYYTTPVYTVPSHTTYYFGSNHDTYAPSTGTYVVTPYGYVP